MFGFSRTKAACNRQGSGDTIILRSKNSDHTRALVVDLNLSRLLGVEVKDITLVTDQWLWLLSGNSKSVDIYLNIMHNNY